MRLIAKWHRIPCKLTNVEGAADKHKSHTQSQPVQASAARTCAIRLHAVEVVLTSTAKLATTAERDAILSVVVRWRLSFTFTKKSNILLYVNIILCTCIIHQRDNFTLGGTPLKTRRSRVTSITSRTSITSHAIHRCDP